jgi:TPP-dependent pyruvate/acetoin dehydrogenase alpha subunit
VDGNDVLSCFDAAKRAVDRARDGDGVTMLELITYRRKGHAEHDNQSYVPAGEIDRWATTNDPIDRYVAVLMEREGVTRAMLDEIDARVEREVTDAADEAERSPMPEPRDALVGIYADPPETETLWYREGIRSAVEKHERPASWGTHDA